MDFQKGKCAITCTLLSLIDEPIPLLKRRPILLTGSFVVLRFVYFLFFLGFTQQAELGYGRP